MNTHPLSLRFALALSIIAAPLHAQTEQQPSIFEPTLIPLPPGSPQPAAPALPSTPIQPAPGSATNATQSSCELLASNTVRAKLQDIRRVPLSQIAPSGSVNIAIFEVVEALAHEQFSRFGDPAIKEDSIFAVELRDDLPGQPREVADEIAQMELGESAILKIDHIFLTNNSIHLRPCSRIAIKAKSPRPSPTVLPASTPSVIPAENISPESNVIIEGDRPANIDPTALDPNDAQASQAIQSIHEQQARAQNNSQTYINEQGIRIETRQSDSGLINGYPIIENIRIHDEPIPGTNQMRRRMFIGEVEVNPETRQPLTNPKLHAGH